jgi:hypothetical protein
LDAYGKACDIQQGHSPVRALGKVALKTKHFFLCIENPERCGPVAVDRHAVAVAAPEAAPKVSYVGVYAKVAAAYRKAAKARNVKPHEMQAVTWCQHRTEKGLNDNGGWE